VVVKSALLHHIALRTHDVPRLTNFYREVIGLSVSRAGPSGTGVGSPGDRTWLEVSGVVLMIEPAETGEPLPAAGSLDLLAFAAGTLEEAEARCARAGVTIEARTAFTVYIRDPDGRRIGLSVYAFTA
jgi:catechol 2,3-dioxygenase-like lactoylglutathione lyase family enzyme